MPEVKPPVKHHWDCAKNWFTPAAVNLYRCDCGCEAQRDADVEWYDSHQANDAEQGAEAVLNELDAVRQARLSTAREKDEYIKFMWQMIKFCPNCGAYLPQNLNGTRTHTCSNCNWSGESLKSRYGEEK